MSTAETSFKLDEINHSDIIAAISCITGDKTPAYDSILARFLEENVDVLVFCLLQLLYYAIQEGHNGTVYKSLKFALDTEGEIIIAQEIIEQFQF